MMPAALAAVWLSCPAFAPGDAFPIPAQVGCPVPVAGLIYPLDHNDSDRGMLVAIDRSAAALRECAEGRETEAGEWSPVVWFALGAAAAAGAVAGVGLTR